mmetsp:Transcript_47977/g.111973  ORF Transcript_47977/g.111973 Transcript_47977/m.111973 type:complete len:484 (-) Transcript_47977:187-1638(-)
MTSSEGLGSLRVRLPTEDSHAASSSLAADVEADYGATDSPTKKSSHPKISRRHTFHHGEQVYPSRTARWTIAEDEETMGDVAIVINLLADLTPAGILPLSFGMSATGYVPAVLLLLLFAAAAGYMMYLVARSMEISGQLSYDKIWIDTIGPKSAWIPPAIIVVVCFGCCLAYACMFGDLFGGMGLVYFPRTFWLVALACFPLLPLCMLKDLSALAPTSFGALIAVIYTAIMMLVRYLDGTYALGGQFHVAASTSAPPAQSHHLWAISPGSLVLVNGLAVAFLCHYNGCKYYREFIKHRPARFASRIALAFTGCVTLFAGCMVLGYATFGSDSAAVILNNYAANDSLATIARIGMGLANVFSFPLMFSGLREAVLALVCFISPSMSEMCELVVFQNLLSACMLCVITVAAVLLTDAGLVVGLVGALAGISVIYVIPCLLFECTMRKHMDEHGKTKYFLERVLVRSIGCIGLVLVVGGTVATLIY